MFEKITSVSVRLSHIHQFVGGTVDGDRHDIEVDHDQYVRCYLGKHYRPKGAIFTLPERCDKTGSIYRANHVVRGGYENDKHS
jgi:hypothetical protein